MANPSEMHIVVQGVAAGHSLLDYLKAEVARSGFSRISACAAYASYRGTVLVRSLLSGNNNAEYRWLIGLDDALTDPLALRVAMQTQSSETRIAELLTKSPKRRFHPKAYLLDLNKEETATLIVGSCNMTEAALKTNCEVFAVYQAQTNEDVRRVQEYWNSIWEIGEAATENAITEYQEKYKRTSHRDPVVQKEVPSQAAPRHIAKAVKATINTSSLAWIVLGKNTGGGNQLDIVKDLAPFLGLPVNPRDGVKAILSITTQLGRKKYQLTFTKGMWRFMNLQQGFSEHLRPNINQPSPYVLAITRSMKDKKLSMEILPKASQEAVDMTKNSIENGFVGRSVPGPSGRLYGWY